MMGVYRLYALGRMSGSTFNKTIKVLERDLHVIPNAYAQDINNFCERNGLLYEKDEKATKLYYEKKPFKNVKEYTAFEEVKEIAETPKVEVKEPTLKKEDITETIAELRSAYEALAGKKALAMWGKVKLVQEINQFN